MMRDTDAAAGLRCKLILAAGLIVFALLTAYVGRCPPKEPETTDSVLCQHRTWEQRLTSKQYKPYMNRLRSVPACSTANPRDFPVPLLRPRAGSDDGQCALAVVSAGMPRSGSTLSVRLINEAIAQLGLAPNVLRTFIDSEAEAARASRPGTGYVSSHATLYWQEHLRLSSGVTKGQPADQACAAARDWHQKHQLMLDSATSTSILIVKSHEFDASLFDLCRHTVVVSSTRDIGDIAASKAKLGWVNLGEAPADKLGNSVAGAVAEHNCWQRFSPSFVELHHEDLSQFYGLTVLKIMGAVAEKVPWLALDRLELNLTAVDAKFRHTDANPWQTTKTNAREPPSSAVLDAVRRRYAEWQRAHGYPVAGALPQRFERHDTPRSKLALPYGVT